MYWVFSNGTHFPDPSEEFVCKKCGKKKTLWHMGRTAEWICDECFAEKYGSKYERMKQ
jgi:ribosomal protein L37AE/L43A